MLLDDRPGHIGVALVGSRGAKPEDVAEEALPPLLVLLPPGAHRGGVVTRGSAHRHVLILRGDAELLPGLAGHALDPEAEEAQLGKDLVAQGQDVE